MNRQVFHINLKEKKRNERKRSVPKIKDVREKKTELKWIFTRQRGEDHKKDE